MIRSVSTSVLALLVSTSLAGAQNPDAGAKGGDRPPAAQSEGPRGESGRAPSARDNAPGQVKSPDGPAREAAPGQSKADDGNRSARDEAPGRVKDRDKAAADDRGNDKPDSPERAGRDRDAASTGAAKGEEGRGPNDKGDAKGSDKGGKFAGVPSEKKTEVRTLFSKHRVEPARNLNISINVGVAVPRSVKLYPVPEDIVVVVPAYRGYLYFLIDDRICVVDPGTYEIVDVIILV